jgi:hypothetical protein
MVPAAAIAKCGDLTYSTALSRQGACSSHGGVVEWRVPADATARCGDGTFSTSASRQGTCSNHAGVLEWIDQTAGADSSAALLTPEQEQFLVATMKSDLRDLVTAEESYFADSVKYTTRLGNDGVNYAYSEGNTAPHVTLSADGWLAVIGNTFNRTKCAIFIGSTAQTPATKEGDPACTQP